MRWPPTSGNEVLVSLPPPLPRDRGTHAIHDEDAPYRIVTAVRYFQCGLLLTRAS
jgi:hypothetical protein